MDLDQISSEQKAAAIVIALGVDKASSIYKYLDDTDIEKLTVEIAKLGYFSSEITEAILDEFYKTCMTQKVVTEGGIEYARSVLEKAFGEDAAANLLGKVEKNLKTRAFSFLAKSDNKTIFTLLHNERPQTIALVLSYLDSDRAANIISELDESKRLSVVEAIARMDGAAPESMKIIERELQKKMSSVMTTDYAKIGGIDYIADVMNYVDRSNEKFIFDELGKKDAELVDEIRKKMFVFEDIVGMDRLSVQRFLRDV
ncbi:MAG: flagellar motor switch protein FliG, partial [Anaerotignaceae bacterium]